MNGADLRYYGLCLELAFIVGYLLLRWQLERGGADREEPGDFVAYGFLGALAGARLGEVLFYQLDRVSRDPGWIFKLSQGGLASHGAAIGLGLAMFWFTRRRAIPFLEGTDRLAFSIPPAAFLFRLGNLCNSEIVGKPTDGSWGFSFPRYDRTDEIVFRHPTQLYEMALAALVFAALLVADWRYGREKRPRGMLTAVLLIVLFSGRILVEFWKEPQPGEIARILNLGQLLSIPFVLAGVLILGTTLRRPESAGWVVGSPNR